MKDIGMAGEAAAAAAGPGPVMERVRAYSRKSGRRGEEGVPPEDWERVNTTSRASKDHWGRAFSPMLIGPVSMYGGYESQTLEAAWQYSKVYRARRKRICTEDPCTRPRCPHYADEMETLDHIGADGLPSVAWWAWAKAGWENPLDVSDPVARERLRRPMGSGGDVAYTYWDGERLSYVEARKAVYIPLYIRAVTETPGPARDAWERLRREYDSGKCLKLYDVDGRNLFNAGLSYEEALNDPTHPFGHSLVLCGLLEGVDFTKLNVWEENTLAYKERSTAAATATGR